MTIQDSATYYDVRSVTVLSTYEVITPGTSPAYQVTYSSRNFQNRVRRGYRNSRWKAQIASGSDATTTYNCFWREYEWSGFSLVVNFDDLNTVPPTSRQWVYRGDRFWVQLSTPDGADDATSKAVAKNMALERFVKHTRSKLATFQGGKFGAELRQTLGMLRRPYGNVRASLETYVGKLQRMKMRAIRNKHTTRRLLEEAAEAWIETSFGMRPFFSDFADLCEAIGRAAEQMPQLQMRVGGTGQAFKQPVPISTVTSGGAFGSAVVADIHEVWSYKTRLYGAINCTVEGSASTDLTRFGLGPEDFLPSVWEAIPYSWLVDYFSNMSKIIDAYSLLTNRVKRIAIVERNTQTRSLKGWRMVSPVPNGPTWANARSYLLKGTGSISITHYDRSTYNGSLVPDFQIRYPDRASQYLNLASLLILRKKVLPFKSTG